MKRALCSWLPLATLGLLSLSCGRVRASQPRDLLPGTDGNVSSAGGGAPVALDDLATLKVQGNTRVPKGVFIALVHDAGGDNRAVVRHLYQEIAAINRSEHLIPTAELKEPTPQQLAKQQITLVVLYAKGHADEYQQLLQALGGTEAAPPPYIMGSESDVGNGDLWMQDFGKFAAGTLKGHADAAPVHVLLDTQRNHYRGEFNPEIFMRLFHLPLLKLGRSADISGQYGGNIDATPNGVLYLGDMVDEAVSTRPQLPEEDRALTEHPGLFNQLKALGNDDAVKISTSWLVVGHADEVFTYTPSRLACGSVLYYGHPLLAMKLLLENSTGAEFDQYADEIAHSVSFHQVATLAADDIGLPLTRDSLGEALASFRRTPGLAISTELADYDLTRTDPRWDKLLNRTAGFTPAEYAELAKVPGLLARFYVWRNLKAQESIAQSVQKLLAASTCRQLEPIAQAFRPNFDPLGASPKTLVYTGEIAHLPGMVNNLVLRNHVIVPDPGIEAMRVQARTAFAKHLGGDAESEHVHFIDDMVYHREFGEIHCGTNVLREIDLDFQF